MKSYKRGPNRFFNSVLFTGDVKFIDLTLESDTDNYKSRGNDENSILLFPELKNIMCHIISFKLKLT